MKLSTRSARTADSAPAAGRVGPDNGCQARRVNLLSVRTARAAGSCVGREGPVVTMHAWRRRSVAVWPVGSSLRRVATSAGAAAAGGAGGHRPASTVRCDHAAIRVDQSLSDEVLEHLQRRTPSRPLQRLARDAREVPGVIVQHRATPFSPETAPKASLKPRSLTLAGLSAESPAPSAREALTSGRRGRRAT